MTPRDQVEQQLSARHVAPAIIERVLRLSEPYPEGVLLRGFHYKRTIRDLRLTRDCTTKGDFVRRYGRDAWDRVPASGKFRQGRRQYVTRQGASAAVNPQ